MKDIKVYIKESKIHGINADTEEIKDYVRYQIEEIISDNDLDIEIIDLYVHGSRIRGDHKESSDLDVVLYYKGKMKEDSLFNILHDDEYKDMFVYDDIEIDINPIHDEETGSLKSYIEKDKNYKK